MLPMVAMAVPIVAIARHSTQVRVPIASGEEGCLKVAM